VILANGHLLAARIEHIDAVVDALMEHLQFASGRQLDLWTRTPVTCRNGIGMAWSRWCKVGPVRESDRRDPTGLPGVTAGDETRSMSEYNYRHFPLDLDADTFAAFSSVLKAGGPAPDGELLDAHTGELVRLSDLWRVETLLMEFGSFT
jgi:hypothetical protein